MTGAHACDHCGLPLGAGRIERRVGGDPHAFCCLGCSIAWRFAGPSHRGGGGVSAALLARIGLGFVFTMAVMLVQWIQYLDPSAANDPTYARVAPWVQGLLCLPVLLGLGLPILLSAASGLSRARVGADLLVGIALVAGYAASWWTVLEGQTEPLWFDTVAALATLMTVGRWMEASAKRRATRSLSAFLSASERPARRLARPDAAPENDEHVAADALAPGDHVRVLPGERVPADGRVVSGRAFVDEAALTGEPLPRAVGPGDLVRAPTVPSDGALVVAVEAVGGDTLLGRIADVLAAARARRAPLERLADRIASVFVPLVLLLAGGVLAHDLAIGRPLADGLLHALSVLVVSCPCALGIATPLAVTTALGALAERGVLVRTGEALGALPRVRRVVFDKTGTLTLGTPRVVRVVPVDGESTERVVALAAAAESGSEHPLARGIRAAADAPAMATSSRVVAGRGVEATVVEGGREVAVRVGAPSWLAGPVPEAGTPGVVGVEADGQVVGAIVLGDEPRARAADALRQLAAEGVGVQIASGDAQVAVDDLARRLDVPGLEARGGLLPDAKVEALLEGPRPVAFVGDGLNDAPALAAADLGIAVGSGTDLARESADVSLLGSDLTRVPALLVAARATRRAVAWNLFQAFVYNVVAIGVAVVVGLPPLLAALAMIVSSLAVIGSTVALRARLQALLAGPPGAQAVRPASPSGATPA
ncbi:MAG: heavy metal translocating P-type ATPase [Planctomycetota bacterium]|nr:cadmium-translocating P-type ATPase [Planctomycetota bacterium]